MGHQRTHAGVRDQGTFTRQSFQITGAPQATLEGSHYILLNALGSAERADGKHLYNPATQKIEVQWVQGIGSEEGTRRRLRRG